MTPEQKKILLSKIDDCEAAFCDDDSNINAETYARGRAVDYVDSLLAEKDAVIERLKAQLESVRAAHDEAQSVLSVLNADPTVAMFQIAAHFQVMGNKVGRILQEAPING